MAYASILMLPDAFSELLKRLLFNDSGWFNTPGLCSLVCGGLANMLFVAAYVSMLVGLKRPFGLALSFWLSAAATISCVLAVIPFGITEPVPLFYPGFGLWLASMLALALGTRQWRMKKRDLN
jgi:hypothetical protein